jgi:hypothetical protein
MAKTPWRVELHIRELTRTSENRFMAPTHLREVK